MAGFIPNHDLVFGQGSLILVTGASGMIGVHTCHEALKAGFRVRGTVRSTEKGLAVANLLQSTDFEFVVVEDMAAGDAFAEAMNGVAAAIHTASNHDFPSSLDDVRIPLLRGSMNILEAALANPTVRRVVFTSTADTAVRAGRGVKFHVELDTWNTEAFDLVRTLPVQRLAELGFEWKTEVYRVAKLEVEQAVWEFVREKKPAFAVNVVSPGLNFGNAMGSVGVIGTQVLILLDGNTPLIPSYHMIDVIDDARIHVAAAIDSTVSDERIFACNEPLTWHRVAQIIQRLLPDADLAQTDPNEPSDNSTIDNSTIDNSTIDNRLGADLLAKWWHQPGYRSLEQTVRGTVDMCLQKRNGQYKRRETATG